MEQSLQWHDGQLLQIYVCKVRAMMMTIAKLVTLPGIGVKSTHVRVWCLIQVMVDEDIILIQDKMGLTRTNRTTQAYEPWIC